MKKCLRCGYLNEEEMKICENCKGSLEEAENAEIHAEPDLSKKSNKSNLNLIIFWVICSILFILFFTASIYESESQKKELINKDQEIKKLENQVESIQKEYDLYKEKMKQYEDVFQYAKDIKDYGELKTEIENLQKEKDETESSITELKEKYDNLIKEMELARNPKASSDNLVYSDDKVEIYFYGITREGVVFEVKNMTDINLTFQADSIAINGISTNDIIMSDDVTQQSVGKIVAKCSDFKNIENVYSVSGQLKVIDFSSSNWDTYKAKFTNVEIN